MYQAHEDDPAGACFAQVLRGYRSAARLTQEQLAERSGLSTRAIANMERRRTSRPYRRSVQRLADALELAGPQRERLERVARSAPPGPDPQPGPDLPETAQATAGPPAARAPGPSGLSAMVPRQLPAVPDFAGRAQELTMLTGALATARPAGATAAASGTLTIWAVTGPAGVGKSTLAVHWAHQAADRFPDGQLYAHLRGFDPALRPAAPAEAVRAFLEALGVAPADVPSAEQAQAMLYRSILARRRMLIVLDDAREPGQVRPLLPGSPGCAVVVTSRHQLTGLVAADGARPLVLDLLTLDDSRELLGRRLGAHRLEREPRAALELVRLCGRLPLALAVVAARAALNPGLTLAELAADLRRAASRLDAIDTGEAATSLRASFSASYQALSRPAARMFRLLGAHPGAGITAAAAARLAGLPADSACVLLRELAGFHLVSERRPGRFAIHELLRGYAAERARAEGCR
jgi:hypothetical protein